MKKLHYGQGYQYAHDTEDQVADMDCLPESLLGQRFYHPKKVGVEARVKQRLEEIEKKRNKKR